MEKLRELAKEYNVYLDDDQLDKFQKLYELLIEKNKVMNLTGITQIDEVIVKHFVDSIALCKYYDFDKKIKVIDIGTGAGFPGIPLKIAFPKIEILLCDSLNKRILFIDEVIEKIGLKDQGISTLHMRAEEKARENQYREKYDLCVSRAVANLTVLSEYCIPFVKTGGYFVSYKSDNIEQEKVSAENAIDKLGGKIEKTEKLELANMDIGRSFIFIKKIKKTPNFLPRKAVEIKNTPL